MKPPEPRPGKHLSVVEVDGRNTAPTVPPPADPRPPPKELAAPRAPLPSIRDQTLAELAEQTRQAKAEAEALREALAAKQAPAPPPAPVAAPEATPTRAQWQTATFRVVVSLGAVLTALATILGVRSATTIEPKVDRTADKQAQQATKTTTVEERVLALERYARAHAAWERCMDAERDSAIERGTGHRVEGSHEDVSWIEQMSPKAIPRTIWKSPPWSVARDPSKDQTGCGAEPSPPMTPPPVPPP
jgi:hypothetical protein